VLSSPSRRRSLPFFFSDTATPRITPFPYTTLFRSERATLVAKVERLENDPTLAPLAKQHPGIGTAVLEETARLHGGDPENLELRSEEHTSELQSRENLVCRLLLEKKKTTAIKPNNQ